MLDAGAFVEVEVLVDLRLLLALGGLIDRELDPAAAVGDHLRHQGRVLGRDLLVGEVDHLGHAEHPLVVLDPFLHVAKGDVPHHVVDADEQAVRGRGGPLVARLEPGEEGAGVAVSLDEGVARLAVGLDRGQPDRPVLV